MKKTTIVLNLALIEIDFLKKINFGIKICNFEDEIYYSIMCIYRFI